MLNIFRKIGKINLKTIYFNFKYFQFIDALKFPVLISNNVLFHTLKGRIIITQPLYAGMIKIGYGDVGIFDKKKSRGILEINGDLIFNGAAHIGHGAKISIAENAQLVIGKNFSLTAESSIIAAKRIDIGDDCIFSWEILVMDTDYHSIVDSKNNILNQPKPVAVGNHVWIGCRSTILKGSVIPDDSVIGANSLVNKTLSPGNSLFSGMPANKIKSDINWVK